MGRLFAAFALVTGCTFSGATSTADPTEDSPDAGAGSGDPGAGPDAQTSALDLDGDGVPNTTDNCPLIANADQADEDVDVVGNACDNCPHIANADQANLGETSNGQAIDGVGDVCDPLPSQSGQRLALFLPFDNASEIATWQAAGINADFRVDQGQLRQLGSSDLAILWKNNLGLANAWITTEVNFDSLVANQRFRGVAVMTRFERSIDFGHGAGCGEMTDALFMGNDAFNNLMRFTGLAFNNAAVNFNATVAAGHTARYTVHHQSGDVYNCQVGTSQFTGTMPLAKQNGSGINLAAWGARVSFKYLVVID